MDPRFTQDLLQRLDIVEVVGRYVPLKRSGSNLMARCPFHNEKSPSFSVSPSKQFYHCFGCGKSGDAIRFLMDFAGMGFMDAVRELASSVGMALPAEQPLSPAQAAAQQAKQAQRAQLTDVMAHACTWWTTQLKTSSRAQAYIHQRGLSAEIVTRFQLGYAPAQWQGLALAFGSSFSGATHHAVPSYQDPQLLETGLVIDSDKEDGKALAHKRRYDRFRDRLMFPIRNSRGQIIAAGGRILDQGEPKYLNSPETPLFSKGQELYGLFEARLALSKMGYALVTEGYMDVLALAQAGFENAVATLGTACSSTHVQKLFRYTDKIVFAFDGDAAGQRAAFKALEIALPFVTDQKSAHFLFLPPEHDPDSFIRAHSRDAFAQCVASATPLSRLLQDISRQGCDLQHAEGRARYCTRAMALWQQMPDSLLKRQVLADIAKIAHLPEYDLLQMHQGHVSQTAARAAQARPNTLNTQNTLNSQSTPNASYAKRANAKERSHSPRSASFTWRPTRPLAGRVHAPKREDRALGILFAHTSLWHELSDEDHHTLSNWEAPYGPLFTWLEQQMIELGALSYAALSLQLRSHAVLATHGEHLEKMVQACGEDAAIEHQELRNILDRMQADQDAAEMRRIVQDPSQLERYRYLLSKQQERASRLNPALNQPPHVGRDHAANPTSQPSERAR